MHDPIVPSSSPRSSISGHSKQRTTKKTCSKFSFEDIKEVHKRRYLLQPIALEVFSLDGRNSLIVFPRKIRNKVYARFMSVATSVTDNAQDSLMGQKRGANVETAGILSNLIGETSVTQRWVVSIDDMCVGSLSPYTVVICSKARRNLEFPVLDELEYIGRSFVQ